MAADFTALFAHALAWPQIESLPATLNARWSPEAAAPPGRSASPAWSFCPEVHPDRSLQAEFESAGHLLFKGPEGFDAQVFRRVFELYNWTRWWSFISDSSVQTSLRQTCRLVAKVLGTTRVIYLPDSHYAASGARGLPFKGADFDQITAWLAQNGGPPADSIEAMAGVGSGAPQDANGYYIDTF